MINHYAGGGEDIQFVWTWWNLRDSVTESAMNNLGLVRRVSAKTMLFDVLLIGA